MSENRRRWYNTFTFGWICAFIFWAIPTGFFGGFRSDSTGVRIARCFELTPPAHGRYDDAELVALQPQIDQVMTKWSEDIMSKEATFSHLWEKALTDGNAQYRQSMIHEADELREEIEQQGRSLDKLASLAQTHGFSATPDASHYANFKRVYGRTGL